MKIIIKRNILNDKLNIVAKAISSKNIIPVLSGIIFELNEEGLNLLASNDDITIKTFIDIKNIEKIEEKGSIIIPGRYLLEIIRKIEDEFIEIETDGLKIIISTKTGEYTLNGMDANEFPNIKFELVDKPIILNQLILKNIINQTCFAASTQESRPILTGVNFKIEKSILECIATDSYRLSKKTINLNNNDNNLNIVIPGKNLLELLKILPEEDGNIEIHILSNSVLIKTDEMLFQSRLLNGSYPDTSKLIPENFELTLTLKLTEIYNAIDRVSLLTSEKDKNLIKMEIMEDEIILSSTSQEIGKIEERIKLENKIKSEMKIAYSSKYMLEALRSLKCENIEIKLNGEIKPIIIKSVEDDNLIQLVLPIKTF